MLTSQAAWRAAVEAEPPTIVVVTATPTSPVARDASQLSFATVVHFTLEAGRDGSATNSLLAFCVLTFKAYAEAFGCESPLPQSLESLVPTHPHGEGSTLSRYDTVTRRTRQLWISSRSAPRLL